MLPDGLLHVEWLKIGNRLLQVYVQVFIAAIHDGFEALL